MVRIITRADAEAHGRTIDRPAGYYWTVFPYSDGTRPWEPGYWNNEAKLWSLIGSPNGWFEFQLIAVGSPIADTPPAPLPIGCGASLN